MEPSTVAATMAILSDEEFIRIRRRASQDPLLWDDFLEMPMPRGMPPADVWQVLTAIRRGTALRLGAPHYRVVPTWYTVPTSSQVGLRQIEARCRVGSPLHRAIAERTGRHFAIQQMIEEAIASAQRDGLDIDYEAAREVLKGRRNPRSGAERLILNNHRVLCDLDAYAGREFTPGLVQELYERLIEGALDDQTSCKPRPLPVVHPFHADSVAAIEYVCALANGTAHDPGQHPIATAVSMQAAFWGFRPLARWNAMVESIVSRLYVIKMGYPVLQYLPMSKAMMEFEDGVIRPPAILRTFRESIVDCGDSQDMTPFFAINLQIVLRELDDLERIITTMQVRDSYLCGLLSCDPRINHRQRAILDLALRVPEEEFRISVHRVMHNVAYATARADLFGLVERGFLWRETRNKAFIFHPRPDLKALIENSALSE